MRQAPSQSAQLAWAAQAPQCLTPLASCKSKASRCLHRAPARSSFLGPGHAGFCPRAQRLQMGGRKQARLCRRRSAALTWAMVNVDFSPALVLGMGFVACGLSLYQLRRFQPELSRDFDVVVSSIAIFSGGILVFQGWRLDPLLLFCQLLTAGTALGFALEALGLRQQMQANPVSDKRLRYELRPDLQERQPQAGISLPEPGEAPYGQWSGGEAGAGWPQTQLWQENVYQAEYDVAADRVSEDDTGFYGRYDAASSGSGRPEVSSAEEGAGYPASYTDGRYEGRRSEPSKKGSGAGQWGRGWSSRIDVEASDDWD